MARMLSDDIDYSAYERQTEASMKVRAASLFSEDLRRHFQPPEHRARRPRMTSTKLRNCIDFLPGETTVWAGYNGHRKSMLAGQVAADLCAMGERTLIASFEMQPQATLGRMARQVWGVARPSDRQQDVFMRWTDDRLWLFDHMGRINPRQCVSVIRYFANELEGQHVFIDSMMMVCASEDHLDEQKQFMTDLVREAQETGLHVHLIAHCRKPTDESKPPTKYDLRGSAAISDQAHNVVMVWANKAKKTGLERNPQDESLLAQADAAVIVEKQRSGSFEGGVKLWWDEASFRFIDDRGSYVEPFPMEDEQYAFEETA